MKSIYLTLVLVGLLLAGCTTPAEQTPANESETTPDINETAPDVNDTTVMPPAEKDCGTDMDCFISEAENCSKARMNHSIALDFFGVMINTTSLMQINASEGEKCIFYIRNENVDVYFTQNMTQKLLDEGKTMAEIDAAELNASTTVKASAEENKINQLCRFDSKEDLVNMLKKWQAGNFSTSDYENAECVEITS